MPRVLFGYFLHDAKSDNPYSLSGASRFCKPRFSSPQWRLRTNKIKTFPKRASRFCKPRISAQNYKFALTKLKPFFPPFGGVPAGTAHSVCFCAACGGISRRQSRLYKLSFRKVFRGFANLESAHRCCGEPQPLRGFYSVISK